jgi:hypothetical protein
LLAAVPSAAAIACALAWRRSARPGWLVAAGLAAGCAPLMKQSGIDGLVVAAAVSVGGGDRRSRIAHLGLVLVGAAVPLGAAAVHGALVGWHAYWSAIGYKLGTPSGGAASLAARFASWRASAGKAASDLALVAAAGVGGAVVELVRRPRSALPGIWLAVAFAGFNPGAS